MPCTQEQLARVRGKIRKKAVFWELLLKALETLYSDCSLKFFLSSPSQGGKTVHLHKQAPVSFDATLHFYM